jgi:hypothetical protein
VKTTNSCFWEHLEVKIWDLEKQLEEEQTEWKMQQKLKEQDIWKHEKKLAVGDFGREERDEDYVWMCEK